MTAARAPEARGAGLPALDTPRAQVLLAIADDALVTGHRASHWTGVAPSIEEDLAFSTIAQDGITQAHLWYRLLLGDGATDADVDEVGLGRAPADYRHAIVCERPPRDFAYTLARHWVTVHVDQVRLDALTRSSEPDAAAIAGRLRHELRYHLEHADHWFHRLAHGGDDALGRLRAALSAVVPEALGFFEPVAGEDEPSAAALLPGGHTGLYAPFVEVVTAPLDAVGCAALLPPSVGSLRDALPEDAAGGRIGRHSPDFTDDVWPEMTALHRAHPGASW